jgi:hypothetical protein
VFIAIDFDGTIVRQEGRPYDDVVTPLEFMPNARDALHSLKAAGHKLILWSGRSSPASLYDPSLDPLVRAGVRQLDIERWKSNQPLNQRRFEQMLDFVAVELPGIFDAIDDGAAGKLEVDMFVDDRALRIGPGALAVGWRRIEFLYGESPVMALKGTKKDGKSDNARV